MVDDRKLFALLVVQRGKVRDVSVRCQVNLDGPSCGGRDVGAPVIAVVDQPGLVLALERQNIGE